MKTIVLCFGNEFLKQDSLAKDIADEIHINNVEFKKSDSVNDVLNYEDYDNLFILDVVKNIEYVVLIDDINKLKTSDIYSLHDFDLSFFLKLMKKLGKIKKIKIIGIPQKGDKEKIISQIEEIVTTRKV